MKTPRIAVVGAGPGGLTAAMILAKRGFDVHVYERFDRVGGRNASLTLGEYTFDTGPTFLMMPQILEEVFSLAGRDVHTYLQLRKLDPLYRLRFEGGRDFLPSADHDETVRRIEAMFPGDGEGYRRFLKEEGVKLDRLLPCLRVPYDRWYHNLRPRMIRALPYFDVHKSVYDCVSRYFTHEELRVSMTFQAKYLGMSPWESPGAFTILSLIEHKFGIFHPIGGLFKISEAMADVVREHGGTIHLNSPVKRLIVEKGKARGIELENGEQERFDSLVMNADFAYAMSSLTEEKDRRKYSDDSLAKKKYSCSTFMLYLGVGKTYDVPHHNIVFSNDYRKNVDDIVKRGVLSDDPSFYIQNASVTDPTLAPEGKSSLYVLVPVPDASADVDWAQQGPAFRDRVIDAIKRKTELTDIDSHIEQEKIITPADWKSQYNVYRGAVFNLAHVTNQMLYLRPRNEFESIGNIYLAGGGTHPGSGLPTIMESGRISADLITRRFGKGFWETFPRFTKAQGGYRVP